MERFLIQLLFQVLQMATPEVRKELCSLIAQLEEKAKKTPNGADDLLVYFLKNLLGC